MALAKGEYRGNSERFQSLLAEALREPCAEKLGEGHYGAAYKLCMVKKIGGVDSCQDCLVVKIGNAERIPDIQKIVEKEFSTQLAAWQTVRDTSFRYLIPRPFLKYENCIFMQVQDTFRSFQMNETITDIQVKAFLWQLLAIYHLISQEYPEFRHNDLIAPTNVLISINPLPYKFSALGRSPNLLGLGLKSISILDFGIAELQGSEDKDLIEPLQFCAKHFQAGKFAENPDLNPAIIKSVLISLYSEKFATMKASQRSGFLAKMIRMVEEWWSKSRSPQTLLQKMIDAPEEYPRENVAKQITLAVREFAELSNDLWWYDAANVDTDPEGVIQGYLLALATPKPTYESILASPFFDELFTS